MKQYLLHFIYLILLAGCYEPTPEKNTIKKKQQFVFKETIAKGSDTGMIALGAFKRSNVADVLCQHWQLEAVVDPDVVSGEKLPGNNTPGFIVHDIILFKDSSVVLNPFQNLQLGRWRTHIYENERRLKIYIDGEVERQYKLARLTSRQMVCGFEDDESNYLNFLSSGVLHRNMQNDPFHPLNNRWRIMPTAKENDNAIKARIKNCLRFFALYFRDHIKRNGETISFKGLPEIFTWYNRGIGLPDKDELSDTWISCFYNKEQALTGYLLLRKLIVDYDYDWPKRAPAWTYATHSVLEQMYHRIDSMK